MPEDPKIHPNIHPAFATTLKSLATQLNDEARHVHIVMAHVRHTLGNDPTLYGRLEAASGSASSR